MKFKRYAAYIILLAIVAVLFIFIPYSETEEAGLSPYRPVTITYAHCYEEGEIGNLFLGLIEEFNMTQGKKVGIIVEPKYYGTVEYLSQIVSEAIIGGMPNINLCDINTVSYETAYLAKTMNKIASPEDYLSKNILNEYIAGYLERGRYTSDSSRDVFPIMNNTHVIYLNNVVWKAFKDAYPRYQDDTFETWEGILEAAVDYYDWTDSLTPDIEGDGKAFIAFESFSDYLFTGSNQLMSSIIQPGHKEVRINLDRRTLYKLWETLYKGFLYGGISIEREETCYDLMSEGEIACYIDSTANVQNYPLAFKDLEENVNETSLSVFGFPTFKGEKAVSPISGNGLIVMNTNEKKQYASFYFLNWLVSQDKYIDMCYENMAIPVKSKAIQSGYAQSILSDNFNSKEMKKKYKAMVLEIANEQIVKNESYAPVEFSGSSGYISEVVDSFYLNVYAGLDEVDKLMKEEYDRRAAVEIASSEEFFDMWYNNMTNIAGKY